MVQRVLIATCLVVMLTCVALVGLSWRWLRQEQLLRKLWLRRPGERSRECSAWPCGTGRGSGARRRTLLELKLSWECPRRSGTARSPDWNPVSVKLTEETPDGPSVGRSAAQRSILKGSSIGIDADCRRMLKAWPDFGMLQPGAYKFEDPRIRRREPSPIAGSEPFPAASAGSTRLQRNVGAGGSLGDG